MPRKSFRQIALDELLGRYHGLYSNILIKYALESDSNIDSDRNRDSDRDSDIDDNELRTDAESSNDNDEPPKLVKYMIESDGESEDKSDSDDENEEPDEQIIAGFNSCIGAENYDDEDPPELEPRFLYEQNVDGGYDGDGDSGSVGSDSDSSNSGVGLDELLFLKVKDDLDAALDSRYCTCSVQSIVKLTTRFSASTLTALRDASSTRRSSKFITAALGMHLTGL